MAGPKRSAAEIPIPAVDPLPFYFKNGYFVGDPDIGFQLNFTREIGDVKKQRRLLGGSPDKQKQIVSECQRAINARIDEINRRIDIWNEKFGNRFMFNAVGDSMDEALRRGEFASTDLKKSLKVEKVRGAKNGAVEFDSGDGWYSARLEGYSETEKKKIAVFGKNKKHLERLAEDGIPGSKFQTALKEYLELNPEIVPSLDPVTRKLADMLKKNRVSNPNGLLENVLLANYTGKNATRMKYNLQGASITPKENPYLFTWPSAKWNKQARLPISEAEKQNIRKALCLHVKGLRVDIRANEQGNISVDWRSRSGAKYSALMRFDREMRKVIVSGAINREYDVIVGDDGKAKVFDTRKVLEADCSLFVKDTLENKLRTIQGVSGLEYELPRNSKSQYRYLFYKTHSRKENPFSESNRIRNQKDKLDNGQIYVAFWKNPKKGVSGRAEFDHIGFVVWRENQLLFNWPTDLKNAKDRVLGELNLPRNATAKASGDRFEITWKDRKTKTDKKAVIRYDDRVRAIVVSGDVNRTYNVKKTGDGRLEVYGGAWFFINNTRNKNMEERLENDSTICSRMIGLDGYTRNLFITPTGIRYEAPQELAPQQKVIKLANDSKLAKEREIAELRQQKQKLRI